MSKYTSANCSPLNEARSSAGDRCVGDRSTQYVSCCHQYDKAIWSGHVDACAYRSRGGGPCSDRGSRCCYTRSSLVDYTNFGKNCRAWHYNWASSASGGVKLHQPMKPDRCQTISNLGLSPASQAQRTPAKFFYRDSDKCLQDSTYDTSWRDWTCAEATDNGNNKNWCTSYARDMMRCCPVSCGTGVLTPNACERLAPNTGNCDYGFFENGYDNLAQKCEIRINCAGSWGQWGQWSGAACGGTQSRTRSYAVTVQAEHGGRACRSPQTQSRDTSACPPVPPSSGDCVGTWSAWGSCSTSCGGSGTKTRTYSITTQAFGGGSTCSFIHHATQAESCGNPCPVDCVGTWSAWDSCRPNSITGRGSKTRTYSITTQAAAGGSTCLISNGARHQQQCVVPSPETTLDPTYGPTSNPTADPIEESTSDQTADSIEESTSDQTAENSGSSCPSECASAISEATCKTIASIHTLPWPCDIWDGFNCYEDLRHKCLGGSNADCDQCAADIVEEELCYCLDADENCSYDLTPASCDGISCGEEVMAACDATKSCVFVQVGNNQGHNDGVCQLMSISDCPSECCYNRPECKAYSAGSFQDGEGCCFFDFDPETHGNGLVDDAGWNTYVIEEETEEEEGAESEAEEEEGAESEGNSCAAHDDCSGETPFCYQAVCDACDACHYCSDGIDGTCGTCGEGYPTMESGDCSGSELDNREKALENRLGVLEVALSSLVAVNGDLITRLAILESHCTDDQWQCGSGECIPSEYYCDGHAGLGTTATWAEDCEDSSDEVLETCCAENSPAYDGVCPATEEEGAESEESVSLQIGVIGATEDNKDQVCDSIAGALGGVSTYCSLTGPQSDRRRLTGEATLYMDAAVSDASSAESQATGSDFVGSLSGLPTEVTVTGVSVPELANNPSSNPTSEPSAIQTLCPTSNPSKAPSKEPSSNPSKNPTSYPTSEPSSNPSKNPTSYPTSEPTKPCEPWCENQTADWNKKCNFRQCAGCSPC